MGLFVSSRFSLSHPHRSCTAGGRGNGLSENADLLLSIVTVTFLGGWPVSRSTVYSFGFAGSSLFGAGRPFFVPSPAVRFLHRPEGSKRPKRYRRSSACRLTVR